MTSKSILFEKDAWPFGFLWSCPECGYPIGCVDVETDTEKGTIYYICFHCLIMFSKNLEEEQSPLK